MKRSLAIYYDNVGLTDQINQVDVFFYVFSPK